MLLLKTGFMLQNHADCKHGSCPRPPGRWSGNGAKGRDARRPTV